MVLSLIILFNWFTAGSALFLHGDTETAYAFVMNAWMLTSMLPFIENLEYSEL